MIENCKWKKNIWECISKRCYALGNCASPNIKTRQMKNSCSCFLTHNDFLVNLIMRHQTFFFCLFFFLFVNQVSLSLIMIILRMNLLETLSVCWSVLQKIRMTNLFVSYYLQRLLSIYLSSLHFHQHLTRSMPLSPSYFQLWKPYASI